MSMTTGNKGQISAEMNITPMIDILLVLIIIFMMIVPVPKMGEMAELPQKQDKKTESSPDYAIVIQVLGGKETRPTLKINEEDVAWEKLENRLEVIFRPRAERIAFLKGDPDVDFQYVAEVLDMTHHAGVVRVGLMNDN